MDTFSEPYTRQGDDVSIDKVRDQIRQLEEEHVRKGIPLSGRIIHVCHYLPIMGTLLRTNVGVLSPPATPPSKLVEVSPDEQKSSEPEPKPTSVWSLSPRYGHAAMISGIGSLSQTHEQLIVGWTGDFQSPTGTDKIPMDTISQQERNDFETTLREYHSKESDPDDENDQRTMYVPVWLEDKVAHGHYDGYCKQSVYFSPLLQSKSIYTPLMTVLWPLFHYLLWQDVATEYASADSHYPYYESANAAFARRIAEVYKPGDLIWIHDYHCLLVPRYVSRLINWPIFLVRVTCICSIIFRTSHSAFPFSTLTDLFW